MFQLFLRRLRTQWYVGPAGKTGLVYEEVRRCVAEACPAGNRRAAVRRREELFGYMQAIESGALLGWQDARVEAEEQAELKRKRTGRG